MANQVGSDNITVASGAGVLAAKSAGVENIASFGNLALGNNTAGNYTLSGASGSVTITRMRHCHPGNVISKSIRLQRERQVWVTAICNFRAPPAM